MSDEQVEFFREHGYVSGIRVLSDAQVERMGGRFFPLLYDPSSLTSNPSP